MLVDFKCKLLQPKKRSLSFKWCALFYKLIPFDFYFSVIPVPIRNCGWLSEIQEANYSLKKSQSSFITVHGYDLLISC